MDIDLVASNGLALALGWYGDLSLEMLCSSARLAYVSFRYGSIKLSLTIVDNVGEDGRECQCENSEDLHDYYSSGR